MKYSINTFLWTTEFNESHLALLPQLKEQGYDGVEIARFNLDEFPVAKIRAMLEQTGLECTFCSGYAQPLSLVSNDSNIRQKTFFHLCQVVEIAAELGAKTLAGPFCAPVGYFCGHRRTSDEWQRAVEGLQLLGETLVQHDITIALEPINRFETYFINTAADAVALCEAVDHPHVGMMLDLFHANIEEKNIAQAIRNSAQHLKHLHLCENDRGIPGTGHLPWSDIFQALKEVEYKGWGAIESFSPSVPETAVLGYIWRDIISTPEAMIGEGLRFLKQQSTTVAKSIALGRY
jgi:D-psicose/D-tagatose/L-ribulose 3-epimerase